MRPSLSVPATLLVCLFSLGLGCTYYECEPHHHEPDDDPCRGGRCERPDAAGLDGGIDDGCSAHDECAVGRACIDRACVPADPCDSDSDCGAGETCDLRDTCVPAGPEAGCTSDASCAASEVCVEGSCRDRRLTCSSDLDCGLGRGCVDNACRPLCSDANPCAEGAICELGRCQPSAECSDGAECGAGERCIDSRCLSRCTGAADCGSDEVCELSVCRPDVAPRPFCASDDDCAAGHPCVSGVCRTVCPSGEDEECLRADVQLIECAPVDDLSLCLARSEIDPECRTASECPAGEHCVDAICR